MITIKDANGNWVVIEEEEVHKLFNGSLIFGLTVSQIGKLKEFYLTQTGKNPEEDLI